MGPGQTQLWGAPPRKRGGSWPRRAKMRWLGKHVSNDTSSVCLSFGLPGATRPQIQCWPAKNKRLQGSVEHHKKIKVTPQGFHMQRLSLSEFSFLPVPCWEGNPTIHSRTCSFLISDQQKHVYSHTQRVELCQNAPAKTPRSSSKQERTTSKLMKQGHVYIPVEVDNQTNPMIW